ncbi:MAG TPA: sodium/proton-translocating pyrophosphatase, partial [Armatimonadota bacterium]|nr:sodium/proton-translocating pyrophosphatase [Armatimonadota bacterium]
MHIARLALGRRLFVIAGLSALILAGFPGISWAGEAIELPTFDNLYLMWPAIIIVAISAIIALLFGAMWWVAIMKQDPGSKGMVEVSRAVREGAWAYLMRQMKTMIWFVIIIFIGLWFMYKGAEGFDAIGRWGIPVYLGVAIAFVMGVGASYLAGLVGMMMAVNANARVANAALSSFKRALYVAFRAGAVSGMATVGLGLLGACIVFYMFQEESMKVL